MVNRGKRLVRSRIQTTIETIQLLIEKEEMMTESLLQDIRALERVIKLVVRYDTMDYEELLRVLEQKSSELSQDIDAVKLVQKIDEARSHEATA